MRREVHGMATKRGVGGITVSIAVTLWNRDSTSVLSAEDLFRTRSRLHRRASLALGNMDSRRKTNRINENALIGQLEELARSLGIEIRYESIKKEGAFFPGGLCRLEGKHVLILNSGAGPRDKIWTLAKAVRHFDLNQVYLRPDLREYLDSFQE